MRHNTHLIQWANGRKIKTIYFAVYRQWHTSTIGLWRNRLTKTIPPYLSIFHVCLYLNYNLFGFLLVSFSNRFTFLVSACVCVCMYVFYLVLFSFWYFFFLTVCCCCCLCHDGICRLVQLFQADKEMPHTMYEYTRANTYFELWFSLPTADVRPWFIAIKGLYLLWLISSVRFFGWRTSQNIANVFYFILRFG